MVRFGRRLGFAGLLVASWSVGCNHAEGPSELETSRASDGGGAPSFATLEEDVGRVLVVGESEQVRHFEREYRGLAKRDHAEDDLVRCELTSGADGFAVSIEAAQGRSSSLQFAAHFLAPNLGAATFEIRPSDSDENAVRVRLEDGNASHLYEYELDGATDPNSLCSVGFSTFDRDHVEGKAACRRLAATGASLDATGTGGDAAGPGSASVTFEFSCPFHVVVESGDGKPATGAGGSAAGGASGGGHGGNTAGTAGNMGGTSGTAAKHCVGASTPCSLRGSATCELGNGCTLDESCGGFASSCYGQIGVYTCTAIQGCFWASSSQSCSGSAWSCSTFVGSLGCTNQPGCDWHSDCTGVAPLCSTLSEFTCGLEPGCSWE